MHIISSHKICTHKMIHIYYPSILIILPQCQKLFLIEASTIHRRLVVTTFKHGMLEMNQTHILHSTFKNILYQIYKSCAHFHYPRPCSILLLPVYKCIRLMRSCYQVEEKKITAVATVCS